MEYSMILCVKHLLIIENALEKKILLRHLNLCAVQLIALFQAFLEEVWKLCGSFSVRVRCRSKRPEKPTLFGVVW